MSKEPQTPETQISENDLIAQRLAKLQELQTKAQANGKTAYPNTFKREDYAQDLQEKFANVDKETIENGEKVYAKVAGRIMLNRGSFMVLQDMTGRIQLYVARKELNDDTLALIKS